MAPTLSDVAQAIDAARAAVPGCLILTREHCHGEDWLLDEDNVTVYLNGGLDPVRAAYAILDAVDALIAAASRKAWTPTLRLVPTQRDEHDEQSTLKILG